LGKGLIRRILFRDKRRGISSVVVKDYLGKGGLWPTRYAPCGGDFVGTASGVDTDGAISADLKARATRRKIRGKGKSAFNFTEEGHPAEVGA